MSNQVLALKYRPKKFEDLIGQDAISTTLSLALDSDRLSHAYLFSGLRGSGKTSTARIMAKALVCKNSPTSKPCDICDGCNAANTNRHMDIIEMDAASNRGIDDIKDLIEHTKYKPTNAKYKVFIIDEVHMLTTQAFNALLKTLEEPPSYVKFILATTDPLKLPATILSRTQHFRFKKINEKNVLNHLTHILNIENIEFEKNALEILIRCGQGSLRDTLTLLDQSIIYSKGIITMTAVTEMMGLIDPDFLDAMFNTIIKKGDILGLFYELENYETGQIIDEISIYIKQKMLLKDVRFDTYVFDRYFRILADAKQLLSLNSDGSFVLLLTLYKLVEATQLKSIDEIIENIQNIPIERDKEDFETKQSTPTSLSPKKVEEVIKNQLVEDIEDNPFLPKKENSIHTMTTINNLADKVEEPNNNPILEETDNIYLDMYSEVEGLIFERSYELGECFVNSFHFNSYQDNILTIDSQATEDCRKILHKHFAYIRAFIQDIYGVNTEIKFNKIPPKDLPQSNNIITQEKSQSDKSNSIEISQGSGCVNSMGNIIEPNESQEDHNINDVLNSKLVQKTIELFQPKTQIKIKSKL